MSKENKAVTVSAWAVTQDTIRRVLEDSEAMFGPDTIMDRYVSDRMEKKYRELFVDERIADDIINGTPDGEVPRGTLRMGLEDANA